METPKLLPTPSPAEDDNGKVLIEEADRSKVENVSSQQAKIVAEKTSAKTPDAGNNASAIVTKGAPSIISSQPSSKESDDSPPSTSAVDVIDSALLAALRDPRERLGLLKLEQILIDFLEKHPQDSYIDIGGPYNSTVISPTLGYIGQQPQQLQAMAQAQSDGTNASRPQTTFQRCILHRICDRFNMTRENSYTTDAYGCYLIRVCKGPDSKKPPRRLLNVKESEYQIPTSNGGSSSIQQLSANFQQVNMSSASLTNPQAGAGGGAPLGAKGNAKIRKMKIMKRSSSNVSNSSSGSNNSKAKNNAPTNKSRSSLSEKEKKYAEARARIFEQEEESIIGNADQSTAAISYNDSSGLGTTAVSLPAYNTTDSQEDNANNNRGGSDHDVHSGYAHPERRAMYNNYNQNRQTPQTYSTSSPASNSATGNNKASLDNSSTTTLNSITSNNIGKGANNDGDQQQTSTNRSKATYRNRQQEETDPDFRRGAGIQLQANPYAHMHTGVGYGATAGGRGAGNVYYPNKIIAANGNNRVGYGYSQQQHYQYQQQQHLPQQHYNTQQHYQAQYYQSNNSVGGRGYAHSSAQYQQQRRHQEQHFPALSSSTSRK